MRCFSHLQKLATTIEMIVYTVILNMANVVAELPFCACDDGSLGNGARGTDVDADVVGVVSFCAAFIPLEVAAVCTVVETSGISANGTATDGFGDGSGKGASGTVGANGTPSLLTELRAPISV